MQIPFNKPYIPEAGRKFLESAISSAHHSGDGPFSKLAEEQLNGITDSFRHMLTPSCTHALEMSILALDIGLGDEVIVPAFTFTSCANAVVMSGATPVFADVSTETFCIDPTKIEESITPKTKAVIVVHYAGIAADMKRIVEISEKYNIKIIEDNAHGLGGYFENKPLGSFGTFSTHSFHETKNIQCGEGGSIAINDQSYVERIEVLREKGTNRTKFFKGSVDKYTWVGKGSSWVQSDLLASLLLGQLVSFEDIQSRRNEIWNFYFKGLHEWSLENQVRLPCVPDYSTHTSHIFYLVFEDMQTRDSIQEILRNNEIMAPFHYQALHTSPAGLKFGKSNGDYKGTMIGANNLLRLPLWHQIKEDQMIKIVETITNLRMDSNEKC